MDLKLAEIATIVGGRLEGPNVRVTGIGIPGRAAPGDLVVVKEPRLLRQASASQAAALIVPEGSPELSKPSIRVANPVQALIRLLNHLGTPPCWGDGESGIHPSASLGSEVTIGQGVYVGPHAAIGHRVVLGDRVRIGANAVVGGGVSIGEDTLICPNVTLYPGVRVGKRVVIHAGAVIGTDGFNYEDDGQAVHKVPCLGTVVIEDDVEVGANTCVDRGVFGATIVGRGSKLDNIVMLAHDVHVGERCGFVGGSGVAGDSTLGDGTMLMARATVSDNLKLAPGTIILACSMLTRDTREPGVYLGFPATTQAQQWRIWRALHRLPQLLDRLLKTKADG